MAVEVNKWTDFLEQLKVANNVITLTADLDGNDAPVTSQVNIAQNVVVNGEGHTVYNIYPSGLSKAIFACGTGANVRFNKVNFYNLYRTDNYEFFYGGGGSRAFVFNECNVQGRGPRFAKNVTMNKCAINWDLGFNGLLFGGSSSSSADTLNDCYVNVNARYNKSAKVDPVINVICYYYTIQNCYFTGSIDLSQATANAQLFRSVVGNTNCTNNVVNITSVSNPEKLAVTGSEDWKSPISIYNSDSTKRQTTTPEMIVPCTTAELHDASLLYAKGFDIVVTQ